MYKISCLDCDVSYVKLKGKKTRIKEHKANIKRSKSSCTVIGTLVGIWTCIGLGKYFIVSESYFPKRLMSEVILKNQGY